MLIGITGKAGAGKDTVALFIASKIAADVYHFADPLKEMALAIDPLTYSREWGVCNLSYYLERVGGWDNAKKNPHVRRFLQRLGTEGAQVTFGQNCWVNLMHDWWYDRDVEMYPHGVIADLRFRHEYFGTTAVGGRILKVIRPDAHDLGSNAAHASETELEGLDYEFLIVNDGDMAALERKVNHLLRELGLR